jgi:glyoxylase-like metal-dependent hydrolase (beta-lactamase superfamily II)
MTIVHHLNCGTLHAPPNPKASCHCLLLANGRDLALVDTGIGLLECQRPLERLGQPLIDSAGWQFDEAATAVRQVERMGYKPSDVKHIVLTHCDPDHAGALVDFPHARVHVSAEEKAALDRGHPRYVPLQFAHGVAWETCSPSTRRWFGLEARPVPLGFESEIFLVPLPGHTLGHCGVASRQGGRWLLHVGDAYYLRAELDTDDHPVSQLAAARADDDAARRASLERLRRLARDHADEVAMFGYHDFGEFPADTRRRDGSGAARARLGRGAARRDRSRRVLALPIARHEPAERATRGAELVAHRPGQRARDGNARRAVAERGGDRVERRRREPRLVRDGVHRVPPVRGQLGAERFQAGEVVEPAPVGPGPRHQGPEPQRVLRDVRGGVPREGDEPERRVRAAAAGELAHRGVDQQLGRPVGRGRRPRGLLDEEAVAARDRRCDEERHRPTGARAAAGRISGPVGGD